MSYGLSAFAVDLKQVRVLFGREDVDLTHRYAASFAKHKPYVQDLINDILGEGSAVTTADIARHVIMGESYDERLGSVYGYFFEHLCDQMGHRQDNHGFSPVSGLDYFRAVDEALESASLLAPGFSLTSLIFSGSPVELPVIDGFPAIGHRVHADLAAPADLLASAPSSNLSDEEFGTAAYTLFQMLARPRAEGLDLVTFYY